MDAPVSVGLGRRVVDLSDGAVRLQKEWQARHLPNLFLVGAAKSGTTALHNYLAQHPDVEMSWFKEPYYFGGDLGIKTRHSSLDAYQSLFGSAFNRKYRGESTPGYLLSTTAATEIARTCPEARIVVLLREPVAMIESLHAQMRFAGHEKEPGLATAVSEGQRELRTGWSTWRRYLDVADYAPQVRRYLDTFPPNQVHVAIFEEFFKNPGSATASLFSWLGLPALPSLQCAHINERTDPRIFGLQRVLAHPHPSIRHILYRDGRIADWALRAREKAMAANVRKFQRTAADRPVIIDLTSATETAVADVEQLLGRDIEVWREARTARTSTPRPH
jgi:hypothetical protein